MTAQTDNLHAIQRRSPEDDAALWSRFRGVPGEDAVVTPVHRIRISGQAPQRFRFHLNPVLPPDTMRGDVLMRDIWRIGQDRFECAAGQAPWAIDMPSRHFADRIHRFDWLPDLYTQGEAGAERARALVDDWIENFGRFHGFAWRTDVAADRVWNWMRCGDGLFGVGDEAAIAARMDALARQARHVTAMLESGSDTVARWRGAVVDVAMSVCLFDDADLDGALMRLESECTAQFQADGGHVSRAPSRGLGGLLDLLTLSELLERSEHGVPEFIARWINRVGAMARFFQAGDGALLVFNDGYESRPEAVAAAIDRLTAPARRFMVAPKSGFHKLEKDGVLLMLDAGRAPEQPFGDWAHAGALAFDLHDGPARLVTSCASSPEVDVDWQAAVRRTSAHSTLVLSGHDSSPFRMNEETRLLYPEGPEGISAKRLEEANEIWLDAQHGGYKGNHGMLHRRRLFMSGDGSRLTGEDSLARPVSQGPAVDAEPIPYDIRFHLHPTVTATLRGESIHLQTESGVSWRFKASGSSARLEKTVYLGRGVVERSRQIVLSGLADADSDGSVPPNCVRWAFLREPAL